jgi:fermentation-respiration switch protein FrsA (DUF1100 family)
MGRSTGPREFDIVVEVGEGQVPQVRVSLYSIGVIGEVCRGVSTADGRLKATWTPGVGTMSFDLLQVAGTPNRAEGALLMAPPGQRDPTSFPLTMVRKPRAEHVPGAEAWSATLEIPGGGSLGMGLTLAAPAGGPPVGALDIPAQGVEKMPLDVERASGAWNIRIPVSETARLLLVPVEDRLEGRFQQGTIDAPIVFHKGASAAPARPALARPQTPKPPFPYEEVPATIRHASGHVLAGTLTLPPGASAAAPVPAVVLATGSGPQDRNEALLGHEPFAVLADALTRAGIAVLRFDDRGVGESTGTFGTATSLDFASDLEAAFEYAKHQPGVDPARVGLLGHSEGALLASIVAARAAQDGRANPPAFVVLMAGTGVNGNEILRRQNRAILEASGVDAPTIASLVAAHGAFLDAVAAGADAAALEAKARALVSAQLAYARRMGQQIPAEAEDAATRQAIATVESPWMRTFLALDPREHLRHVKAPVLALNGLRDTQVVAEQNIPAIRAALAESGAPLTVREYPGLNHLFQRAATGNVQEYAQIDTTIEPEVLRDIALWIRQTTRVTAPWTPPDAPGDTPRRADRGPGDPAAPAAPEHSAAPGTAPSAAPPQSPAPPAR